MFSRAGFPSAPGYRKETHSKAISPRARGRGEASAGEVTADVSSRMAAIRSREAFPRWTRLVTQPRAIIGQESRPK